MTPTDTCRILVVDDDPSCAMLLKKYLSTAGYEVSTAADGTEAMQTLLTKGAPIVVTDWMMPKMNGLELCQTIRQHHEGIPLAYVIIVTAHTDQDRIVEAFDAGADDFLSKPVQPRELLARVRAGQRMIHLQRALDRRNLEVHRYNAEMAIAHAKLGEANEQLNRIVTTDELTGLTNRREAMRLLNEYWASSVRRSEPFSCVMLDIDHFKNFNDTYGHATGDLVLRETATTLQRTTRSEERVSRVGGEEFLILLPNTSESTAAFAAERMRRAIESHSIRDGDRELRVTISLGVAERTPNMHGPENLTQAADDALYAAKYRGRNRVALAGESEQVTPIANVVEPFDPSLAPVSTDPQPMRCKPKILVADDDASFRVYCRAILEREGYEKIIEAVDGRDALAKIESEKPAVVILDGDMPSMNGRECTRRLKENPATRAIPVLFVSARSGTSGIRAALDAGADDYISKTIESSVLVRRVEIMVKMQNLALDLTRANEIRGERSRAMGILFDYARALVAATTLAAITEQTITVIAKLLGVRRVSFMLADPTGDCLTIANSLGIPEERVAKVQFIAGQAIPGQVMASGEPYLVNTCDELSPSLRNTDELIFGEAPLMCTPLTISDQVIGVLTLGQRHNSQSFEDYNLEYIDLISKIAAAAVREVQTLRARDEARDSIVFALAKLAEYRDSDTGKHLDRVTRFCILLAEELRPLEPYRKIIDDRFLQALRRAVPLHDIGKVAIPDRILNKPGRLDPDELVIMRTHAEIGANTIRSVIEHVPGVVFLQMAEEIAMAHHEWFNGHGYPRGLVGKAIPLAARIAALADVYDALTTKRVYKEAIPHERAVKIITDLSGSQFDPDIFNVFCQQEKEFKRLGEELSDDAIVVSPSDRGVVADLDMDDQGNLAPAGPMVSEH